MERERITDQVAEGVIGGSIVFSTDHTTCGYNCNNQCKVNDYDAVMEFIKNNYQTMNEREMLKAMVKQGLLTRL